MYSCLSTKKDLRRGARAPRLKEVRRRLLLVTMMSVVACTLATSVAPSAGAAAGGVTCLGTQAVNESPGLLLLTPRVTTLTVNEIFAPCISLTHPGITGLSHSSFQTRPITCLALLSPNSFSKVLNWSTGDTSTFAFNQLATTIGGNTVVTLTGVITQGLFAGSTAIETITGPANSLACLFEPGLMNRFNVVTLVILSA